MRRLRLAKVNLPIAFLSLVTSSLLWASVYNAAHKRPDTKELTASLQINNLDHHNFAVTEYPATVSVSVAGNINQIKNVTPYAIANLSGATAGTKTYPVTIVPNSVRDLVVGSITAQIKVEDVTTKSLEIKPSFTGGLPPGKSVSSIEIFPKRIYITGPSSDVRRVDSVQVHIDYASTVATSEGADFIVKAMDKTGMEISKVILRTSDVHPDYTEENLKEPATVRVHLKLESASPTDPNTSALSFPQ